MIKNNPSIQFHFLTPLALSARKTLKGFIASVFRKEKMSFQRIDIIFCADEYLLALNRQFLSHDFYTDILSFPLSRRGASLIAEIYISADRVRENAKNLDVSLKMELHRVIFHGVLHLCGYKDKSVSEIRKMRSAENMYLKTYFKHKV